MNDFKLRKIFKSFDIKDVYVFRSAENLLHIANSRSWRVFRTSNIKKNFIEEVISGSLEEIITERYPSHSVTVSSLKGLPFSSPSLLVNITEKGKVIYESIFLSVSNSTEVNDLPFLILVPNSIKRSYTHKIHTILDNFFCCNTVPVRPTLLEEIWIIGICLHETMRKRKSDLHMKKRLKITKTVCDIELSVAGESLQELWKFTSDTQNDYLSSEKLITFLNSLYEHFTETYGIEISRGELVSLCLADCSIYLKENCFRFAASKPEIVFSLLSYIESDCCSV